MKKRFNEIWTNSRKSILTGEIAQTLFANGKLVDLKYIIALVVVIDVQRTNVLSQITAIQDKLREVDPDHYYYPASSIHVTVAGCTPFYSAISELSDERIERIRKECQKIIDSWDSDIILQIGGLNAIPSSIFLEVNSLDGNFGQFRQRILSSLKAIGETPIEQLDTGQIHMNIMKFTHREHKRLEKLIPIIETFRNKSLGEIKINNVELDLTDRIQSPFTTKVIHRFSMP